MNKMCGCSLSCDVKLETQLVSIASLMILC